MIMVYYHSDEHEVPIIDISDELKENIHEGRAAVKEIRWDFCSCYWTGYTYLKHLIE